MAPERTAIFKIPAFLKLTDTDPFAVWFVVTGDATLDGIRAVRWVLGAISSLSIVAGPMVGHFGGALAQHCEGTEVWIGCLGIQPRVR